MLNVGSINDGVVLDHIEAGKSMEIYKHLGLDKLDCQVAIIKNARSNKMGRKDIIKIDGSLAVINLDILGYIDHNITVNIIHDGQIIDKKKLTLPKVIKNVLDARILDVSLLSSRSLTRFSLLQMRQSRFTDADIVKKSIAKRKNNNIEYKRLSHLSADVFY